VATEEESHTGAQRHGEEAVVGRLYFTPLCLRASVCDFCRRRAAGEGCDCRQGTPAAAGSGFEYEARREGGAAAAFGDNSRQRAVARDRREVQAAGVEG